MYIFVFLWTPVLMPASPPLGMVFACFMVAIMIGSSIYTILLAKGYKAEQCLRIILITIGSSMLVCCLTASPDRSTMHMILIYGAFLVLEIALGMYFPAMSYLKRYVRNCMHQIQMYFPTRLNISKHHFRDLQPNNSRKSSCQCDEFIQSPYECDNLHSTFRLELGDVCSRQAFDVSILLGIVNDWLSSFQCFHQGYVQDYSRCGLGQ